MNSIKKSSVILSRRHPNFRQLVAVIGDLGFDIPVWKNIEDAAVYSVIGQMLSNAASSAIIAKLRKRFSTSKRIISWAAKTAGRAGPLHGVSQRKRKALRAWLEFSQENNNAWKKWAALPLAEYREEVSNIWGFGRWSADMIAIFFLARMDVWPESDAGIKRAASAVFGNNNGSVKDYVDGCETVASLYLWELLNRNLTDRFKENGQLNA